MSDNTAIAVIFASLFACATALFMTFVILDHIEKKLRISSGYYEQEAVRKLAAVEKALKP